MDDEHDHHYASFWTHIEALRCALLRILAIIGVGVIICFLCYSPLIAFLTSPLTETTTKAQAPLIHTPLAQIYIFNALSTSQVVTLPAEAFAPTNLSAGVMPLTSHTYRLPAGGSLIYAKKTVPTTALVLLGPLEGMLTALKTSFWLGGVLTSPLWLLVCMQFIAPALRASEKRLILPFLITSLAFILLGCAFAFMLTIPLANTYLIAFNQEIGTNLWSLTHYLDYTVFLLLANGLSFELCAVGLFAVQLGLITAESLIAKRRIAIVCAFVLGALLTPPDILTQVMLAIPLMLLYEAVILYARLVQAKAPC